MHGGVRGVGGGESPNWPTRADFVTAQTLTEMDDIGNLCASVDAVWPCRGAFRSSMHPPRASTGSSLRRIPPAIQVCLWLAVAASLAPASATAPSQLYGSTPGYISPGRTILSHKYRQRVLTHIRTSPCLLATLRPRGQGISCTLSVPPSFPRF